MRFRAFVILAMAGLALLVAGCGGDDTKEAELKKNQAQAEEQIQEASNDVTISKSSDPAVQKAQRELAEQAKKQKAEAIKKGTTPRPENRSDVKCDSFGYFIAISTAGHKCSKAIKLIKSQGDEWVKLPANPTKVGRFSCQRISEPATTIKINCIDITGTVTFSLQAKS